MSSESSGCSLKRIDPVINEETPLNPSNPVASAFCSYGRKVEQWDEIMLAV